ncbi:MAG: hypothetical protein GF393_12775 [Armatimonadia bacterium]|nr:hypothetical protein [Armatimonadia bacterium]
MNYFFRPAQRHDNLIAGGSSESPVIDLGSLVPVALHIPGVFAPASITFRCGIDPDEAQISEFYSLVDEDGSEYVIAPNPQRHIALTPVRFAGAVKLIVRAGTHTAPLILGQDFDFTLMLRMP